MLGAVQGRLLFSESKFGKERRESELRAQTLEEGQLGWGPGQPTAACQPFHGAVPERRADPHLCLWGGEQGRPLSWDQEPPISSSPDVDLDTVKTQNIPIPSRIPPASLFRHPAPFLTLPATHLANPHFPGFVIPTMLIKGSCSGCQEGGLDQAEPFPPPAPPSFSDTHLQPVGTATRLRLTRLRGAPPSGSLSTGGRQPGVSGSLGAGG